MQRDRKRPASADVKGVLGNTIDNNCQHKKPALNADLLMAKELNELSLEEREQVYEDIHGIPRLVEEDSAFVNNSLLQLDQALSSLTKKAAYDKAFFLSPNHVSSPKMRIMFLRANNFQID
jgi:hypothetical protein